MDDRHRPYLVLGRTGREAPTEPRHSRTSRRGSLFFGVRGRQRRDDGGYSKDSVQFDLGPLPIVIPNPPARVEAVRFHDLHHIVTGYQTDWRGEFERSCFEIGAGCGPLWFAWLINLGGVAEGLFLLPRRSARAWARGRASGGLCRLAFDDALLERSVAEVAETLGLAGTEPRPKLRDWLGLGMTGVAVTGVSLAPLAALVGLTRWLVG